MTGKILVVGPWVYEMLRRGLGHDLSPGARLLWIAAGRPFIG